MTSIPAAQYLRVSTERQEYSLDCQSARIADYAQKNGFAVYQTYCDEAKSGLEIGRGAGLSELIQDAVGANPMSNSRLRRESWGRFQDPMKLLPLFCCKVSGTQVYGKQRS